MRSVPMVLRRYVFTRLIVQKAVAVDTGMQSRTRRHCKFCSPTHLFCAHCVSLQVLIEPQKLFGRVVKGKRYCKDSCHHVLSVHRVGGVYNGEIQPVRLAVSVYSSRNDGLDASLDPLLLPGHVRRTIITMAAHCLNVYSKSLKVVEEGISQSFAGGRLALGKPNELLPETCFLCIVKSKAESHLLHSGSHS
ncbi:hypothetical protein DPMN_110683 [Dreissena polymorpha]|uniref:Uncharacterized protein n=1 Tax=Dreissena polymorpha TaxID=45954 RepID=A0A9D4QN97_DREPO|nr:hypothetical protein DPMN_110683 [Dreissena polymorpha]